MPSLELDHVLDTMVPDWDTRPVENPPGNALASQLRHIMDDSKSIFRHSVYTSQGAQKHRWTSIFKTDYKDVHAMARAASAPDGTRKDKMFMSWKVPDRVTTGDGSRYSARSVRGSLDANKPEARRNTQNISDTQLPRIGSSFPRVEQHRSASAIPYTPRLDTGLAKLTLNNDTNKPVSPVNKVTTPRLPKGYKISELLNRYYLPCSSAEEWLQKASPAERQTVEKALIILEKSAKPGRDKTSKSVDKWLRDATREERAVALEFFQTVGMRISNNPEQKDRINQIIAKLRRGRVHPGILPTPEPSAADERFRYLRLLSPDTRDKKWMHQTWHHLPPTCDNDPVNNRSAIYTQPHKITPRHYVIHPDLG